MRMKAWDVEERRWIPEGMFAITGTGSLLTFEPEQDIWLADEISVKLCRSIGLSDKAGREIFEGDIVRLVDSIGARNGEVYFEPRMLSWCVRYAETAQFGGRDLLVDAEVIGHVFENPELLLAA